jgi:hypothetical protein
MPDTGDFDHRNDRQGGPRGWGDAFAALPQEAPDAGAWERVRARLPAPATRSAARWPLWLAMAASLVLAVAIPLRMLPQAEPDAPATVAVAGAAPVAARPVAASSIAIDTAPASTPASASASPHVAQREATRRAVSGMRSPPAIRTPAPPSGATRLASAEAAPAIDLEPLYAQSAQLESLLSMARDERVASGTSAALSDGLDARVASIDAALAGPGLDAQQRAELWSQRVDALQQLVGIETTQRLYAARGETYQAALVSID